MHRFAARENESSEPAVDGCFEHVGHAQNVDSRRESSIFVDERSHHVSEMNCVRDVGMLVKYVHHVAEIANVHWKRIEAGSGPLGKACESSESPLIRRLIGRDDRNFASEQIAHYGLADKAHAAGYEKFHARHIVILIFIRAFPQAFGSMAGSGL